MPRKYRLLITNKSSKRKKKQIFVDVRDTNLFSQERMSSYVPFRLPHFITTTTEKLTQEQIKLLKKLEARGLLPKITWIESGPNGFDDKIKYALVYLHSVEAQEMGCMMRKGYDYAWIKIALNRGKIPERYSKYRFMSTPKFVEFILSLGFRDIAGPKTINKFIAQATWNSERSNLSFHGCYISYTEIKRRNSIVSKFLEIMNEI